MFLIDEWAERHISSALKRGELENLSGEGKPLQLDDDSHVPADLRAGYRLLKMLGVYLLRSSKERKPQR